MKKIIVNTIFTTGASLVILAAFLIFFNVETILVSTVFQILGANIVINCGLFLLFIKIECRYVIVEYILNISYIITVLVIFGLIFDWYSAVPVWVLVIMAIVIYLIAMITSISIIKKDAKDINELLKKRKEKMENTAA